VSRPDPLVARVYEQLDAAYHGETWHWSPHYVRGPMDVIAGAVLVQHTTWRNAERALERLHEAGALNPERLAAIDEERLRDLVRVSGTPSVKARRLRAVAHTIVEAGGLAAFLALPDAELRARLLATHGVGRETADAIALYAAERRVFVVDAYTKRLFSRIGVRPPADSYDAWQRLLEEAMPAADATLFQRFHAWIVLHCKSICRPAPRCESCVLRASCAFARDHSGAPSSR